MITFSYALIDFGLAMPVPGTKHSFLKGKANSWIHKFHLQLVTNVII